MSQIDSRNSSAAKRARTDDSRRIDDWTCPSCGNVNFSFRKTCNSLQCSQPRPADYKLKSSANPVQAPQGYSYSAPYMGAGAPTSMQFVLRPDWPCPKSGKVNYSFRTVCNMRKCNTPKPGSQGPGNDDSSKRSIPEGSWKCEKCNNINYPFRTKCNRRSCRAHKPAESEKSPSPPQEESDQGLRLDWQCPKCGNVNYSFRTVCNMRKCRTPKPRSQGPGNDDSSKQSIPEGSWKCEKCNNINYPFRTKCNRRSCRAHKPAESEKSPSPPQEKSDQ